VSTRKLIETAVKMIETEIQSKISTALTNVSTYRTGDEVALPVPQSYFIFPKAAGYRTPAIFTIADGVSFEKDRGANHINAAARITVAALLENQDLNRLVLQTWRYQAALHEILDQTELSSTDSKVRLMIRVTDIDFSSEYTVADDPNDPRAIFRKEVHLRCDVNHIEQF